MRNLHERMIPGLKVPGSFAVSVFALIFTAVFVLASALMITRSLLESSVDAKQVDVITRLLASNKMMDKSEERFNGRSIFYVPREPIRERPPPPPRPIPTRVPDPDPEPRLEPPPSPPPSTYAGPDVQSILGNQVFFMNGKRVPEGQTVEGVTVLRVDGAFKVRLGWRDGEYDVELFAQQMPDFFGKKPYEDSIRNDLVSIGSSSTFGRASSSASESTGSSRTEPSRNSSSSSSLNPNKIPEPLTDAELKSMTRTQITKRIGDVFRGMRNKDIDPETKERLETERKTLMQMLRESSSTNDEK